MWFGCDACGESVSLVGWVNLMGVATCGDYSDHMKCDGCGEFDVCGDCSYHVSVVAHPLLAVS